MKLYALSLALVLISVAQLAANVDPPLESPNVSPEVQRIFFGSCLVPQRTHPIFDVINAAKPDLFIFAGDNVYADTTNPKAMKGHYEALYKSWRFQTLVSQSKVLAIWDDHDYGENDTGADYPMKTESERQFETFWKFSPNGEAANRPGIYQSYLFGPPERRVQLILLDTRYFRTPLVRDTRGKNPGPYQQNPQPDATILGETQWQWFEQELERPAKIRIIVSSIQVLASENGWESWANFTHDKKRFLDAVAQRNGGIPIIVSGDRHFAEMSRAALPDRTQLVEVTSSGLNRSYPADMPTANGNRLDGYYLQHNYGEINIRWNNEIPEIEIAVSDQSGNRVLEYTVR